MTHDFDIHGLLGIRLLDARPSDIAAVRRQLGPLDATLTRTPDLVVRFVDRLPGSGDAQILGQPDAEFTATEFFVLRGKHKSKTCVQVPFAQLGERCELTVEHGVPNVPLLVSIVNLTLLVRGYVPLHACAFEYRGTGVLCTGWSKSGKTEALLAFMANGASYIGDEWVYLDRTGERMWGLPEPICVWNWHLDSIPTYRQVLSRRERFGMRTLEWMAGAAGLLDRNGVARRGRRVIQRSTQLLHRQLHAEIAPERLFGRQRCLYQGRLDKVFLVSSQVAADYRVAPIAADEVAQRMAFSLREEFSGLRSWYHRFRFAFPQAANPHLDRLDQLLEDGVRTALRGKQAWVARHPYPFSLPQLFAAMATEL